MVQSPPTDQEQGNPSSVLFVANYSPLAVGGVGQFIIDLGTRLQERGMGVSVCFREEAREFNAPPRMARARLLGIAGPRHRVLGTIFIMLRTARTLVRERKRFDVCHVIVPQPMTAMAVLMSRVLGRPVVATVFAPYPRRGRWIADAFLAASERFVLRNASAVAFECEETKRRFPGIDGTVVLNGIDVDYYRPSEEARERLRGEKAISPSDVVFAFVGRVTRSKGVHDLLGAFARLPGPVRSRARILVVGPLEESVERILPAGFPDANRVRWIGAVGKDEVLNYYLASDAFVLPSYAEGISSSLVEAMACGIPAIASRTGGNPEVVTDGESGYLVPSSDVETLSDRLSILIRDPETRNGLGRGARRRIVERFTLDGMANGYVALYRSVSGPVS